MVKFVTAKVAWWCMVMLLVCAMPFTAASAKEQPTPVKRKAISSSKTSKVVVRGASVRRASMRKVRFHSVQPSFGHMYGLHAGDNPLELRSSVALVMDQDTNEILIDKNAQAVLPIASITKLMTALVVAEAQQPLDEMLTITQDDVDTEKGSHSRLRVGTQLDRGEMLHLALMASENRAANALGRNFPGGLDAFVAAMNAKARLLGMRDTHYVEPTGLSSRNQASARDLATLVNAAYQHQLIRDLSISPEHQVAVGRRQLQFRNTNLLVRNSAWDIGLQKTGYIAEAGRCLVMQASLAGRKVIMVFLDSAGKYSRIGDAERVRRWITEQTPLVSPTSSHTPSSATTPLVVPAETEVPVTPVAVTS
jgi:D-alanyl-D-alanine endopeptidase (penicillin-binding protein 7)